MYFKKYLLSFFQEKILLKKPKKPVGAFFLFSKTLDRGEAPVIEFVKVRIGKKDQFFIFLFLIQ